MTDTIETTIDKVAAYIMSGNTPSSLDNGCSVLSAMLAAIFVAK